jgi:hypothetical protein
VRVDLPQTVGQQGQAVAVTAVRRGRAEQAEVEVRLVGRVSVLESANASSASGASGPSMSAILRSKSSASSGVISVPPGGIHTAVAVAFALSRTHG